MTKRLVFTIALAALMTCASAPGGVRAAGQGRQKSQKVTTRYACPMDPEVTSRRPGKCPKCGMALRPAEDEVVGPAPANAAAGPAKEGTGATPPPRIPDTAVYNQNGRRLNFYTDLVKGRVVAINFIFTTCTTICPPLTATFRRVRQDLDEALGRDVQLISVSVDPTTDTPERLYDFAAKFKAGPGWTFVTGEKTEMDSLLQALGASAANRNDHTPMVLVGNDATGRWTRTYGLSSPAVLVKVITEAANHE